MKNIQLAKAMDLASLIEYKPGQVISLTFAQNEAVGITLFSFSQNESISTHSSSGDAMVYILDGKAQITIGSETLTATKGQVVVMPSNVPHALEAIENFKMLLVVVM